MGVDGLAGPWHLPSTLVHAAVVFENKPIARAEAGSSCKIQGVSHGERTAES